MSKRFDPGWVCFGVALGVRLLVVLWAAQRFPPEADGAYYHVVASRIAEGLGYTWLWPDGAVTYAAHYPVGYPAVIGALYAVVGPWPWVAMLFNALVGAFAAFAGQRLLAQSSLPRGAWFGGLALALHPSLVFYTPALMTEGVVGSGLVVLAWLASRGPSASRRAQHARFAAGSVLLGLLCLLRPQVILLAPLVAWLSYRRVARQERPRGAPQPGRRWLLLSLATSGAFMIALAVTSPWTARNCARMDQCVWVSANGGWNLLIGAAPHATGGWVGAEDVGFPEECREVWGEVAKDRCLGAAARRMILAAPTRWLSLIPAKLGHTFNWGDAPGWYLHTSNPAAFGDAARGVLFAVELLALRGALLGLLLGCGWWHPAAGGPRRWRRGLALLCVPLLFVKWLWPAYIGVWVLLAASKPTPSQGLAVWALGTTLLTHAVFFGSSRYALVAVPALALAAIGVLTVRLRQRDTGAEEILDAPYRD